MKTKKVLTVILVEDDDIDAMAVERSFRRELPGVNLVRAADGVEGLATIRQLRTQHTAPVLVILDLNMPRMSGVELLAELRRDPDLATTIAFVLTTSNDQRDLKSAYEHNVAGYIVKDFDGAAKNDVATLVRAYIDTIAFPPIPA